MTKYLVISNGYYHNPIIHDEKNLLKTFQVQQQIENNENIKDVIFNFMQINSIYMIDDNKMTNLKQLTIKDVVKLFKQ